MKYTFLEHTADAKFRAFGKSLEEAFANAAEAMFKIMVDPDHIAATTEKKVIVSGADEKALLYNFLEELLVFMDAERFLLHRIKRIKIEQKAGKYALIAVAVGDKGGDYESHGQVKAVTYNDMEIKKQKNRCTVQVVVDT